MATIDQLYPGEYIKAGEFNDQPVTLTLKSVERKPISDGSGGEEPAVVVEFKETDKKFIMNKTNAVCLRAMFGDDSEEWAGHRVTLHPVKDESGLSDSGQCIRVKGSPELDKQMKFQARLGRRMITQTLVKTDDAKAPNVDATTGEVKEPEKPAEPEPAEPTPAAVPQDEML